MVNKRNIAIFLILLGLSGCVATRSTIKEEKPFEKSRVFEVPFDMLWSDVIQTINVGGREIRGISKEKDFGCIAISEPLPSAKINEVAIVPAGIISWDYLGALVTVKMKMIDNFHTEVTVGVNFCGRGYNWWERYFSFWPLPWAMFANGTDVEMGSRGVIEREYLDNISSFASGTKTYAWLDNEIKIEDLIAMLKDKDVTRRRTAVSRLAKFKDTKLIEPLIGCLNDKDSRVRKEAVLTLSKFGEPAVMPIITCLNDKDASVRANAALVLGNLSNSNAVEPLIASLKDNNSLVRKNTALALGKLKDRRAVNPLIDSLKDEDFNVRRESIVALSKIGDIRAFTALNSVLKDENNIEVRQETILALSKFGKPALEPLLDCLKDKDWDIRKSTVQVLENFKVLRTIEALIECMKDECKLAPANKDNYIIVYDIAYVLARMGELAVEPLIVCLNDGRLEVQCAAARALGEIKDKRAIEPLIQCLRKRQKKHFYGSMDESTPLVGIGNNFTYFDLHIEVKEALKKIAGEDFGTSYSRWQRWYNQEGKKK